MKKLMVVLGMLGAVLSGYGQGTVLLSNLGGGVNAPVYRYDVVGGSGPTGLGPAFSAQLYLVGPINSVTPLLPITTFRPAGTSPETAIADRYFESKIIQVPGVAPGTKATFLVRAWRTSLGPFDAAKATGGDYAESAPVDVVVGGGTLPPANLVGLQSFAIAPLAWPEPSVLALGGLGAIVLLLLRKKG